MFVCPEDSQIPLCKYTSLSIIQVRASSYCMGDILLFVLYHSHVIVLGIFGRSTTSTLYSSRSQPSALFLYGAIARILSSTKYMQCNRYPPYSTAHAKESPKWREQKDSILLIPTVSWLQTRRTLPRSHPDHQEAKHNCSSRKQSNVEFWFCLVKL